MNLEEAARTELLSIRKHADGITVGALARTEALRQVLGGGDPRLAYNAIKHMVFAQSDDLPVTAAAYSLGFASSRQTHLDRLTDFGIDYGYDQRQARRYSDKGITEIARRIATEWTIEATPSLDVHILRVDGARLELLLRTERLPFIEMSKPLVEMVEAAGSRTAVTYEWHEEDHIDSIRSSVTIVIPQGGQPPPAASIRWQGEVWPRFRVVMTLRTTEASEFDTQTLGNRLQITALHLGAEGTAADSLARDEGGRSRTSER